MATIFHIALASDWAAAQESGAYTTSTLGMTLAEVGFIHASRADQWTATRDRFYADVTEPLVLLHIDTDLLDVPLVEEQGHPDSPETFPHLYGRLSPAAVVRATPLPPAGATAPTTAPTSAPTSTPQGDFTSTFFREIAVNAGLLLLAMGVSLAGIAIGGAVQSRVGPGIGGLLGLALGVAAAVRIHRRRSTSA